MCLSPSAIPEKYVITCLGREPGWNIEGNQLHCARTTATAPGCANNCIRAGAARTGQAHHSARYWSAPSATRETRAAGAEKLKRWSQTSLSLPRPCEQGGGHLCRPDG